MTFLESRRCDISSSSHMIHSLNYSTLQVLDFETTFVFLTVVLSNINLIYSSILAEVLLSYLLFQNYVRTG